MLLVEVLELIFLIADAASELVMGCPIIASSLREYAFQITPQLGRFQFSLTRFTYSFIWLRGYMSLRASSLQESGSE